MVAAERGGAVNASAEEERAASIVVYAIAREFHVDRVDDDGWFGFTAPVTGVFARSAGTGGKTWEYVKTWELRKFLS